MEKNNNDVPVVLLCGITVSRPTMSEVANFPGRKRTICIPDEINLEHIDVFRSYLWSYYSYSMKTMPKNKDLVWEIIILWIREGRIHGRQKTRTNYFPVEWDWLCSALNCSNNDSLAEEMMKVML